MDVLHNDEEVKALIYKLDENDLSKSELEMFARLEQCITIV